MLPYVRNVGDGVLHAMQLSRLKMAAPFPILYWFSSAREKSLDVADIVDFFRPSPVQDDICLERISAS